MLDNLQTLLQSVLQSAPQGKVIVNLLDGSTAKSGTLNRVGADYLLILDSSDPTPGAFAIPFNAIATIQAERPM